MPYINVLNGAPSISVNDSAALIGEFNKLRAELDDIRTKYAVIQAGLTAGSAIGAANYPAATTQLAAKQFTPT